MSEQVIVRGPREGRRLMKLADIFETRIEEKIDPVIKVGEVQDEAKLASEIGAYVVRYELHHLGHELLAFLRF